MKLSEPFPLEGEVERYLNNLTEAMRVTLKLKMNEGYDSAATWDSDRDLPRHKVGEIDTFYIAYYYHNLRFMFVIFFFLL